MCMLNGKQCTEGCYPDPEHMGIHSEERYSKSPAMLPGRPWGLWFVNELLYWFASSPCLFRRCQQQCLFHHRPAHFLFLILCSGEVITACYCMCDLNLQACHLPPHPPLLWRLFLSQANLYCGNLRQLSSAQWCKRTNLMPPLPHLKVALPLCLTPPS